MLNSSPSSIHRFATPQTTESSPRRGTPFPRPPAGSPAQPVSHFSTPSPLQEPAWSDSDLSGEGAQRPHRPARTGATPAVRNVHDWLQHALNMPAPATPPRAQPSPLVGLGLANMPRFDGPGPQNGSPRHPTMGLGILGMPFGFNEFSDGGSVNGSPIAPRPHRREHANRPAQGLPMTPHSPGALLRAFEARFTLSEEHIDVRMGSETSRREAGSSPLTQASISEMELGSPQEALRSPPEPLESGRFKRARFG